MYQLSFYVPVNHVDAVKDALFKAGAGRAKGYDGCAWQTLGQGQFRPLVGSHPYLGEIGKLETVAEYKVEMVCADELIKPVVEALIRAHPYEQPAYAIYKILSEEDFG